MRKFKLVSIQEELLDAPIRGVWYNKIMEYGSIGVKTLTVDGVIQNGEVAEKDKDKVWKFNLTVPEPNGRTAILSDESTHFFSNLVHVFECEDFKDEDVKDWNRILTTSTTSLETKEKIIKQSTVWALQHHSEIEVYDANQRQINKNCQYPLFRLYDITSQQQKVIDNELAYLDIVDELRPLFKNDFTAIKDICYGLGMTKQIAENKDNNNGLFMALLKEVKSDPESFSKYFANRVDKINFHKGLAYGIIENNGAAFFIMGEIMGATPEESIAWLKLNPNRYETLKNKLGEIDPRPTQESKSGSLIDVKEVHDKCPFESTAKANAKRLRKKYADNDAAIAELESVFKEIAAKKGWKYEDVFVAE